MDTKKRKLYSSIPKGTLVTSHSQHEKWNHCHRQWFFRHVLKLQEPTSDSLEFGSMLHEIVERYYLGGPKQEVPHHTGDRFDSREDKYIDGALKGQTPGQPLELFPEGWSHGVELEHALVAKKLVQEAIEAGLLLHRTSGVAEWGFSEPLVPGAALIGFVDYVSIFNTYIEDTKTGRSSRYFLGPQELQVDNQLLRYAYVVNQKRPPVKRNGEIPVAHIQFSRDPKSPSVRKTTATVLEENWNEVWERTKENATEMLKVADPKKDFQEVSSVEVGSSACFKYNRACPFLNICRGHTKPEDHNRLLQESQAKDEAAQQQSDELAMSLLSRRKGNKKASKKTRTRREPAPEPTGEVEQVETGWISEPPPWYKEGCKSCKDLAGYTKIGGICPACGSWAGRSGDFDPYLYETRMEDGVGQWRLKPEAEAVVRPEKEPEPDSEPVKMPSSKEPEPQSEPEETPDLTVPPEIEAPVKAKPKLPTEGKTGNWCTDPNGKPGKPVSKGILLVGGTVMLNGSSRKVLVFEHLVEEFRSHYNESTGKEWLQLNSFTRKDLMADNAGHIIEMVGNGILQVLHVPDGSNDTSSLYTRLLGSFQVIHRV